MNLYPPATLLETPEARCRSGVPPLPACRQRESIYGLIELFIQIVHRLSVRSERRLVKTLLADFQRVHGKTALLFRIAEAALNNPDGLVKICILLNQIAAVREVHHTWRSYAMFLLEVMP